jgi:hypothetical protein
VGQVEEVTHESRCYIAVSKQSLNRSAQMARPSIANIDRVEVSVDANDLALELEHPRSEIVSDRSLYARLPIWPHSARNAGCQFEYKFLSWPKVGTPYDGKCKKDSSALALDFDLPTVDVISPVLRKVKILPHQVLSFDNRIGRKLRESGSNTQAGSVAAIRNVIDYHVSERQTIKIRGGTDKPSTYVLVEIGKLVLIKIQPH